MRTQEGGSERGVGSIEEVDGSRVELVGQRDVANVGATQHNVGRVGLDQNLLLDVLDHATLDNDAVGLRGIIQCLLLLLLLLLLLYGRCHVLDLDECRSAGGRRDAREGASHDDSRGRRKASCVYDGRRRVHAYERQTFDQTSRGLYIDAVLLESRALDRGCGTLGTCAPSSNVNERESD